MSSPAKAAGATGSEKQLGPPLLAEAGVGDEQLAEFAGAEIACHDVVLEPLLTRRQGQGESQRRRLERGVEGDGGRFPDAAGGEFGFDHPGRCHRQAAVVFGQVTQWVGGGWKTPPMPRRRPGFAFPAASPRPGGKA